MEALETMSDPTTLYASGEEAISRVIEVEDNDSPRFSTIEEFNKYYDIKRTISAIIEGNYRRVWP